MRYIRNKFGVLFLSLISWFVMPFALEGTMNATSPLVIRLSNICEIMFFVIPPLCISAMLTASVLQKKGFHKAACVAWSIPWVIFALALLLLITLISYSA